MPVAQDVYPSNVECCCATYTRQTQCCVRESSFEILTKWLETRNLKRRLKYRPAIAPQTTRLSQQEPTFKYVDEEKIPVVVRTRSEKWLRIFRNIPKGKALVATEKELGVKAPHLSNVVHTLIRRGLLPATYKVSQRKKGDVIVVYVVNSAKPEDNA